MIARIVKIKGFGKIVAGADVGNIFEDGHVYEATKIMGEIIIRDLGEHAHAEGLVPIGRHKFSTIMLDGTYCLTKEEYNLQLKKEKKKWK